MITAAILGVSGYGGGELVRLLSRHPDVRITHVASETYKDLPLSRAFPGLLGTPSGDLICHGFDPITAALAADIVFMAQESGVAMKCAGEVLALGKRIIDLSADFRLRDVDTFERWYKMEHEAALLLHEGGAVYGLPEINHDLIKGAKLVANPGCYPTAAILALAPLLRAGIITTSPLIIDGKSGISGAGRSKSDTAFRYAEANEATKAYNIAGAHRHTPEIEQELSAQNPQNGDITVSFSPHLVPMTRGLLTTCYAPITGAVGTEDVLAAFRAFYRIAPFVVVRDGGDYPSTKDVYGSNFCHIAAKVDGRTNLVVVTSVIDNLIKGAAGQAIQNMNLMFDLPQTRGLEGTGLWP